MEKVIKKSWGWGIEDNINALNSFLMQYSSNTKRINTVSLTTSLMKYLFSLSLVFLFLNLPAQSKWSIGVIGGVDVANISRDYNWPGSTIGSAPNTVLSPELKRPNIVPRYGFKIEYRTSQRIVLKSGVRFNMQGEKSENNHLRWGSEYDDQGNYVPDPTLPHSVEFVSNDRFIEIPLHLKFMVSSGTWRWFVEGGASPNFYINTTSTSKFDVWENMVQVDVRGSDFRKITSSIDFGFGVEKGFGDKLSFSVQPMFRYFPLRNSTAEEYIFKSYFYNFGMEFECMYSLN